MDCNLQEYEIKYFSKWLNSEIKNSPCWTKESSSQQKQHTYFLLLHISNHIININTSNQTHEFVVHQQINSLNQISQWHTNYHIFW